MSVFVGWYVGKLPERKSEILRLSGKVAGNKDRTGSVTDIGKCVTFVMLW